MMERPERQTGTVRTVLRGDSLRQVVPATPAMGTCGTGQCKTLNGVPLSAAKHCCGRACQHCRIYWPRTGD